MYSFTASMLYLSCADIGTMGDDSATVPGAEFNNSTKVGAERTLDERGDALLVLQRLRLLYEIDLVLEDDDVFELHDLDGCEMLRRLRLGARLVPGDKQQRGVHDRGTVQHGGHENVVARAIDERDVPDELHARIASRPLARRALLLV
jgi:hypothetical protein